MIEPLPKSFSIFDIADCKALSFSAAELATVMVFFAILLFGLGLMLQRYTLRMTVSVNPEKSRRYFYAVGVVISPRHPPVEEPTSDC